MKKLKLSNGEIRLGYEFDDFDEETKNNILWGQANFEVEVMNEDSSYWEEAVKMEEMQTPWFLAECIRFDHEKDLIEKINDYLFDEAGELLPITYHIKDNAVDRIFFEYKKGSVYEVEILEYKIQDFAKMAGF